MDVEMTAEAKHPGLKNEVFERSCEKKRERARRWPAVRREATVEASFTLDLASHRPMIVPAIEREFEG